MFNIVVITTLLVVNGMTVTLISAAQTPDEFVVKVLSDRYLRSPIVVLIEGCYQLVRRTEYIWSKIKQLPTGVELTMASYNSSGMGEPVRALDASEVPSIMDFLKTTTLNTRCKSNFATFKAIKESVEKASPYDSAIILIASLPPNDPDMQLPALEALIKKRSKLQILWLEKGQVPGKYLEITQPTGGEVFEISDQDWLFSNHTNELEDDIEYLDNMPTTIQPLSEDDDKVLQQQVMIAVRRGIRDYLNLPIQVDSSMKDLYITTTGSVYKATIRLPSGAAKELWLQNTTKVPTQMEIGTWLLETVGNNYNVTVHATSRLAYSATVGKRNLTNPSGRNVDLVRLQGEGILDRVVLVDEMGKELTKLENINNLQENLRDNINSNFEENTNNSFNNYNSEWKLPADNLQNKQYYVQIFGQDKSGAKFTRLSSLKTGNYNLLKPIIVELNELSQIVAEPGETINLYYDIINNYYQPIDMMFYAQDNLNFIKGLQPRRLVVMPHTRIQVNLILELQTSSQYTTDVVTLMAESYFGTITAKSYIYIGYQRTDSGIPDISYTTDGYCRDTLSPSICYSKWWSLAATVQDDSGLIRVRSIPNGLQFKSDFIAGTKDKVYVHYSSTCCDTKVDIIAYDINGNIKTKTIDIERVWLTAGEITAIVLGVILAIIVIILIVVLCVICIRRRRNRNFLMHR